MGILMKRFLAITFILLLTSCTDSEDSTSDTVEIAKCSGTLCRVKDQLVTYAGPGSDYRISVVWKNEDLTQGDVSIEDKDSDKKYTGKIVATKGLHTEITVGDGKTIKALEVPGKFTIFTNPEDDNNLVYALQAGTCPTVTSTYQFFFLRQNIRRRFDMDAKSAMHDFGNEDAMGNITLTLKDDGKWSAGLGDQRTFKLGSRLQSENDKKAFFDNFTCTDGIGTLTYDDTPYNIKIESTATLYFLKDTAAIIRANNIKDSVITNIVSNGFVTLDDNITQVNAKDHIKSQMSFSGDNAEAQKELEFQKFIDGLRNGEMLIAGTKSKGDLTELAGNYSIIFNKFTASESGATNTSNKSEIIIYDGLVTNEGLKFADYDFSFAKLSKLKSEGKEQQEDIVDYDFQLSYYEFNSISNNQSIDTKAACEAVEKAYINNTLNNPNVSTLNISKNLYKDPDLSGYTSAAPTTHNTVDGSNNPCVLTTIVYTKETATITHQSGCSQKNYTFKDVVAKTSIKRGNFIEITNPEQCEANYQHSDNSWTKNNIFIYDGTKFTGPVNYVNRKLSKAFTYEGDKYDNIIRGQDKNDENTKILCNNEGNLMVCTGLKNTKDINVELFNILAVKNN